MLQTSLSVCDQQKKKYDSQNENVWRMPRCITINITTTRVHYTMYYRIAHNFTCQCMDNTFSYGLNCMEIRMGENKISSQDSRFGREESIG